MKVPLDANTAWIALIGDIMTHGAESSPRGMKIRELIGHQTVIDMKRPLVTIKDRKMGYRFAAAEAWWILSGDDRVASIEPFSREIAKFSDNGETFFGAYGPRIQNQIDYVLQTLVADKDSRQAVINIWRENPPKSKDIPCSISVQFLIRNNKLNCIYTMRSSDAWLGWVYDTFNFTMLSAYVAIYLKRFYGHIELGSLVLNAGSQHLYQRDWPAVLKIINQKDPETEEYNRFDHQLMSMPIVLIRQLHEFSLERHGALSFVRNWDIGE